MGFNSYKAFKAVAGLITVALVYFLGVKHGVMPIIEMTSPDALDTTGMPKAVIGVIVSIALAAGYFYSCFAATRINRILENIFSIPELVKKILFTLGLLAIYRIGFWIPIPGLDQQAMINIASDRSDVFAKTLETVALFTGGNLGQSTIFGLGIMPYITASIIFQLLGTVIPALENLMKEGERGRRKIQEYTRYATVILCLIQATAWISVTSKFYPEYSGFTYRLLGILSMTTGTVFLMWLGEQIDEYGIGNGISLLIMGGIVARMPSAVVTLMDNATFKLAGGEAAEIGPLKMVALAALFIGVVAGAILIQQAQRRIPIQQAKMTRGRRVYGGQRQYLPLRVNHGGVMPIIFTSALMMFPGIVFQAMTKAWPNAFTAFLFRHFTYNGYLYWLCYIIMIFFFSYFWTTVMFKPKEMADNLREYGSFIPGLRPGRRTAEYLENVMERITFCGSAFLALIAVIPMVISTALGIPYGVSTFLGGTGLLITVSVGLDLAQRIESQLVMRNYGGFLGDNTKLKGTR